MDFIMVVAARCNRCNISLHGARTGYIVRRFYAQDIRVPQLPIQERLAIRTRIYNRAYIEDAQLGCLLQSVPRVQKQEKS